MAEIGARARRNTIGDALRRAGARFRDRPALRFGDGREVGSAFPAAPGEGDRGNEGDTDGEVATRHHRPGRALGLEG